MLFAFELTYSGVFRVQNVPTDQIHPVVMIECPRLLFPFARQIVADAVRNGGFPPLYIDPIDFVALYRQRATELQSRAAARGRHACSAEPDRRGSVGLEPMIGAPERIGSERRTKAAWAARSASVRRDRNGRGRISRDAAVPVWQAGMPRPLGRTVRSRPVCLPPISSI